MDPTPTKANLCVYVRVRPFLSRELENGSSFPVIDVQQNQKELHAYEFLCPDLDSESKVRQMLKNPKHFQVHSHLYDHIFDDKSEQETVYKMTASNCLEYLLKGFNSTIIAYGQTGTGKTHTMEGNQNDQKLKGLIPRVLEDLFVRMGPNGDDDDFKITASYLQIYNEGLSDLLLNGKKKGLMIREDKYKGMYVDGLSEQKLTSAEQALQLLAEGRFKSILGKLFNLN
jgi:kinesin family protein 3/17